MCVLCIKAYIYAYIKKQQILSSIFQYFFLFFSFFGNMLQLLATLGSRAGAVTVAKTTDLSLFCYLTIKLTHIIYLKEPKLRSCGKKKNIFEYFASVFLFFCSVFNIMGHLKNIAQPKDKLIYNATYVKCIQFFPGEAILCQHHYCLVKKVGLQRKENLKKNKAILQKKIKRLKKSLACYFADIA